MIDILALRIWLQSEHYRGIANHSPCLMCRHRPSTFGNRAPGNIGIRCPTQYSIQESHVFLSCS